MINTKLITIEEEIEIRSEHIACSVVEAFHSCDSNKCYFTKDGVDKIRDQIISLCKLFVKGK